MAEDFREFICTKCDYVGRRVKVKPGSTKMELALWIVFLIPGPFYSIWRMLGKKYGCPRCSSTIMVEKRNDNGNEDISMEALSKIPSILENDKRSIKVDDFLSKKNPPKITSDINNQEEEKPSDNTESKSDNYNKPKEEDW